MIKIAVDGPSGAGKGTIAKFLSEKFNLRYLDTGLLYRETARLVIQENLDIKDIQQIETAACSVNYNTINEYLLRNENVAAVASQVAAIPKVRSILTEKMHDFVNETKTPYQGVILDGRDIGTKILPHADVKLYITADPEVRANRRAKELQQNKLTQDVLKNLQMRDIRDTNRSISPLQVADDAIVLDTTHMDIKDACKKAMEIIHSIFSKKSL